MLSLTYPPRWRMEASGSTARSVPRKRQSREQATVKQLQAQERPQTSTRSPRKSSSGRLLDHYRQLIWLPFRCDDRCMITTASHQIEACHPHECSDAFPTLGSVLQSK